MSYYRYKRGNRRFRNSTNVIKMKFQSFIDLSTQTGSMQVITLSAGGKNLIERCPAQFSAYRYYKLGNVSVKLVPASTLPVDPTGLAYGVDQKVDPRDQLSPGLMRITNGEDIFEDISGLSDAQQVSIYNAMMLDQRWYKWMLQRGVKRHGTPRYWQVGQLHQDKWPGAIENLPLIEPVNNAVKGTVPVFHSSVEGVGEGVTYGLGSSPHGLFQTGHKGVLGWLPTDGLQSVRDKDGNLMSVPMLASPPEIEMFKIVLPKAYKTRYYYRAYISETVYFKEPIVQMPSVNRPLDIFHYQRVPMPATPDEGHSYAITDDMTGGNYGDS